MVKVKDTQSFIERARELHGDRYDYSQSVWTGANSPIVYKCNRCGNVLRPSSARKHICEKEKQGCGKCYRRRNFETKEDMEQLKNRPCVSCGKLSSFNAAFFAARNFLYIQCQCLVCGKSVARTSTHVKLYKGACCSDKCQQVWAGRCGKGGVEWTARSKKAQKAWKLKSSADRKKVSSEYRFFLLAKAFLCGESEKSGWEKRCYSSSTTLNQRMTFSKGEAKSKSTSFEDVVKKCFTGYSKLQGRVWEKKCYSTVKNMKWKRRLRNAKRNFSPLTESTKALPKQLTLWG